jgi:hypothetical protein
MFAMLHLKCFVLLGHGAWWGNRVCWETGIGARWTQFHFVLFQIDYLFALRGERHLGRGAASGRISRAGRPGARITVHGKERKGKVLSTFQSLEFNLKLQDR